MTRQQFWIYLGTCRICYVDGERGYIWGFEGHDCFSVSMLRQSVHTTVETRYSHPASILDHRDWVDSCQEHGGVTILIESFHNYIFLVALRPLLVVNCVCTIVIFWVLLEKVSMTKISFGG